MSDNDKRPPQPFDRDNGYSGQDYHRDEEAAMGRAEPSGRVTTTPPAKGEGNAETSLPTDNGRRPSIDPETGEVHGSGAGAGGGHRGDEIDEVDPATPPGVGVRPVN
ncbi:hypothetical protein NZL82_08230 [Sphingomonas sanguinis]|jgi:hypothetical protein|uniref:hypothetical protein n=1 Tax=Sphingomonas sp. LC-1 TaxID=3110957 RepID=UPI0021BB818D|nr:hypothetical protein [Sphingomonas sp. LC-1]MCT8001868.1 hypothetical protein [Sphingomonas sp. LC-1]